ncbi:uncharacterized mitochondrial protein AtMg00810-like [Nicotiana sylvestris]|uniref:uncharacterized mitochondrial protein AtMg00810-like n=1 Tax=Nicotiana sylvestris TaxID=4096 RepID=UPI00388CAC06
MKAEISGLETNQTWTIVDLPLGKTLIRCKWVFKVKYKSTGEVERSVVALAATSGWYIFQIDAHNVFLQGDLLEEVYMHIPDSFSIQGELQQQQQQKVCKLHKSLYGLKQAPRQWNLKLISALTDMGFVQSHYDYSLFTHKVGCDLVVVLVYVDDLLVTGTSLALIQQVRKDLQARFKMKDLGELKFFLGIEFLRSKEGILMNQRKYALELVSEMGLAGSRTAVTPLEFNHKLSSVELDKFLHTNETLVDKELEDRSSYQRLIGRPLYLTMTRPDIAFVVQVLSQYMHAHKDSHMDAAMRVVRYIKGIAGLGLFMLADGSTELSAFCDSDWGACVETRKSVTGYMVKFGQALVSWKSKKQSTVSRSSAEAEFRSMASTVAEITWLIGLFKELD